MRTPSADQISSRIASLLLAIRDAPDDTVCHCAFGAATGYLSAMREVRLLTIEQHLFFLDEAGRLYMSWGKSGRSS